MEHTLQVIAEYVRGALTGQATTRITGVNTLDAVQPGQIAFIDSPQRLAEALRSQASALIVPQGLVVDGKPSITVANPKAAFALVLGLFHPEPATAPGIHPSAVVAPDARLGQDVCVKACAVIGSRASIGRGSIIDAGVVIGEGVMIGEQTWIGPNSVVYHECRIGSRVRVHAGTVIGSDGFGYVFHEGRHVKIPQIGNVVIEDDVELGSSVCVDRATMGSTVIGQGTKIDNQVQIAHNDQVGRHVAIAGQCGISGSVTIGDYAIFGGRVGVADHIDIGRGVRVGIGSILTKSIPEGQIVFGYPARQADKMKQSFAAMQRMPTVLTRLIAFFGRIEALEAKVKALEQQGKGR